MSTPRHTRPERNATVTAGHTTVASTRSVSQFAERIPALEHMFTDHPNNPPTPPVFHKSVRNHARPVLVHQTNRALSGATAAARVANAVDHERLMSVSMSPRWVENTAHIIGLEGANACKRLGGS